MKKSAAMPAAAAMVGGAVFLTAPQASAYTQTGPGGCIASGITLTTQTTANTHSSGCTVQARLDKYVQGYPTSYYGATGTNSDTGYVGVGTWVGNWVKINGSNYRVA